MKKLLLAGVFLCISMTAYAASNDFSGLSVGADIGGLSNFTTVKAIYNYKNLFGGSPDAANSGSQNKSDAQAKWDVLGDLNANYAYALNERVLLAIAGAVYFQSNRDINSSTYGFANPNNRADFPKDYSVITNTYPLSHESIGIMPEYVFNNKILGFLSFSFHNLREGFSSTTQINTSNISPAAVITNQSETKNFEGIGIGGGIKYRLSKRWFFNISAEWVYYENQRVPGPSLTSVPDEITFTQTQKIRPSEADIRFGLSYKF